MIGRNTEWAMVIVTNLFVLTALRGVVVWVFTEPAFMAVLLVARAVAVFGTWRSALSFLNTIEPISAGAVSTTWSELDIFAFRNTMLVGKVAPEPFFAGAILTAWC